MDLDFYRCLAFSLFEYLDTGQKEELDYRIAEILIAEEGLTHEVADSIALTLRD